MYNYRERADLSFSITAATIRPDSVDPPGCALGGDQQRSFFSMASKKGNRIVIKLRSTESAHTYTTMKNRKNDPNRLELRRYDPTLRRHVVYRESK